MFQEQTSAAEKDRFDVGSSTALLLAQDQRDLLAARIAEVDAIVSFRIALVKLYLAEGSLMEMRGIRIASEESLFSRKS
jgi:outer membrane protein TolC